MTRRDTGLTEQRLAELVDRFYDKVRVDSVLGPVFDAVVEDWAAHKRLLTSFWTTVALASRAYRGNPLGKHRPLPIENAHFERWLVLWQETAEEVLDAAGAAIMTSYAQRISVGLRVGVGLAPPPRSRREHATRAHDAGQEGSSSSGSSAGVSMSSN